MLGTESGRTGDSCQPTDKSEYNAIDVAKFVCAILVVSIHAAPLGDSDSLAISLINYGIRNWFSRIAVPFFFAASGFFLYRKTSSGDFSPAPSKAYIIKLLKLYAIWSLIYSPLRIQSILENPDGIIRGLIGYGRDIVFTGSYRQLWHFPALIFSVALISFLLSKKAKLNRMLIFAGIFYAVGLLAQSRFGLIEPLRVNAP